MLPCSISFSNNIHGQSAVTQNACAAGAIAMGDSYRLIQHGIMDAMITGAVDVNVNPYGYTSMEGLGALRVDANDNPDKALCPYDKKRNGAALADGGAIFVVESLESALARNANIYCEIIGYGSHCIGKHISTPLQTGIGSYMTMRHALIEAGITPS